MKLSLAPLASFGSRKNKTAQLLATHILAGRDHVIKNPRTNSLTPRQTEVLELLIDGRSNVEIAFELSISVNTVKAHVSAVLRVLEVPTRGRAAAVGHRLSSVFSDGRAEK
ncbi:MAG: LuxR C-terminal-related transcriptional regulator [Pseudomonadota bacterium]